MERESVAIDVGTTSWYEWLEEHTSFLFVDRVGVVTVHKSGTDHDESIWKASRTRMGKVFIVSLGPSRAINLSNLQAAARKLAGKHAHVGSTTQPTAKPAASIRKPFSRACWEAKWHTKQQLRSKNGRRAGLRH